MPRGRHYYDPIIQTGATVEGAQDLSRIELFPAGPESLGRLPEDHGKWIGRRIGMSGEIVGYSNGDFNHDAALAHAMELWPGLTVYELNAENEDSTWEGVGPSLRMWQNSSPETGAATPPAVPFLSGGPSTDAPTSVAGDEQLLTPVLDEQQIQLRVMPIIEPGNYVLLDDIRALLEMWAVAYEVDKNPSAALALRDAVDALKDVG